MATSVNKTWGGATSTWSTASQWRNDDGTTSAAVPASTATATINGGTITIASQTIGNLIIGGNCTLTGVNSLTVTGNLTVNAGATLTFNASGTLNVSGNLIVNGAIQQTGTGSVALTGSGNVNANFGSSNFTRLNIAKTAIGNTVTFASNLRCEQTNTTASGFTFTSGTLNQNGYTITARTVNNGSSTARNWYMNADVFITLGAPGQGYAAVQTTCTYTNRDGRIRTLGAAGTHTLQFGSGPPATCPRLYLEQDIAYNIVGSLWDFYAHGSQTVSNTIVVFNELGDNKGGAGAQLTAVTCDRVAPTSGDTLTTNSLTRFGAIRFFGAYVSGTTYTNPATHNIDFCRANTINNQAIGNCTWNFNDIEIGSGFTINQLSTGTKSTVYVNKARPIAGVTTTTNVWGASGTGTAGWDIFIEDWDVPGSISHGGANLYIGYVTGANCYTTSFSHATSSRAQNFGTYWGDPTWIVTKSNQPSAPTTGFVSLSSTNFVCNSTNGGYKLAGSGSNVLGTMNTTTQQILVHVTGSNVTISSGTIAYLGIEDGGTITAASTLTINKGYIYRTGESPGTLTGLNLTLTTSDSYNYNFDRRIGTVTVATASQTWTFDNVMCNTLNLNGVGCTYDINGCTVYTAITVSTTAASAATTVNYNGGTTVALNMSTNVNNIHNFNYSFNTTGICTFNIGTLNLNNADLVTGSFVSASGSTRVINWVQNGRIHSSGTGGVLTLNNNTGLTYTALDNDGYWAGGYVHGGTGIATGTTWTATVPSMRWNTWHSGTGTYSAWYTQTFRALDYSSCTGASSIFITGDFYCTTGTAALSGITLTQVFNSGTITMDGDPIYIASYTHTIADQTQNLNRLIASNITLSGARSTYYLGQNNGYDYVKINTNGTLTINGAEAFYYLNYVKGYNVNTTASPSTATLVIDVYNYQHNLFGSSDGSTYAGVSAGTFTHTNGTLTVKSGHTLMTWTWTATDNARPNRNVVFENAGYIQTNGTGTLNHLYISSGIINCGDNGGFVHDSTGSISITTNYTLTSVDNIANLEIKKVASIISGAIARNFKVNEGSSVNSSAIVLSLAKDWTGSTSNTMSNLVITQIINSGVITYTGKPIGTYNHAINDSIASIDNLPALNITLSGQRTTYNLGVLQDANKFLQIATNGTLTLSGADSVYNLYRVRSFNTLLQTATSSNSFTVNCYNYEHNYYNPVNPTAFDLTNPIAGTVTHNNGRVIIKSGYTLTTWAWTGNENSRPARQLTFEGNAYIQTLNTGTLRLHYNPSLILYECNYDNSGFIHNSTGVFVFSGVPDLSNKSNAVNLRILKLCSSENSPCYLRSFTNYTEAGLGSGTLGNSTAHTIAVLGNFDITGNPFDGSIANRTQWQALNVQYVGTSGAVQTFSTFRNFDEVIGSEAIRIGTLSTSSAFTGTLQLTANSVQYCTTLQHDGGTIDLNGKQLWVNTSCASAGTANRALITTTTNYTIPGIYINATTGTPWSFPNTATFNSDWRVWVYVKGGTINHGGTTNQTANQPSFDLTERVNAYGLTPAIGFSVGSLKINNYIVPSNNSVWNIGGPEFTFYTGGQSSPITFTVNILDGGNSKPATQLYVDSNSFTWPQVTISTNAAIACANFKFKNIYIDAGTTTSSGQFVEVVGKLSTSGGSGATLNVTNSTWVFRGSGTVIEYGFLGVGIFIVSNDLTGIFQFEGLNGSNLGDQYAGFASNFGGKIINNIAYNSTTDVGTLFLEAGYSTNTSLPLAGQIDVGYSNASFSFRSDKPPGGLGFPIKGSTFNLGKSGIKRLRSYGGNWGNKGLYNTEASSVVNLDYLDLENCFPAGGGGWYAGANSVDRGGNIGTTGWYFYSFATYSLSRSTSSVDEGGSVTITLTTDAPNGSVVPYTITGITSADISGASLTGNFTVSGGSANVILNIAADYTTEDTEILTLSLSNGAASISVIVNDTSLLPTYSLNRSAVSVTEGGSFTITLTTTNLPNGSLVPYTITGVSSSDINNASLTGNFTISGNSASLVVNTTWDYENESQEIFTLTLNPTYGTGSSISVAINNLLRPTYALAANPTTLNEVGNFTITLTTTDVPDNTTVPYTITGVSTADISGASLTGNFTVVSNTASVTFTTTGDYLTEGDETFVITLNTIGTTVSVLIVDYTKTRTYSLSTSATAVTEGDVFVITLTTTNVFNGTGVPYTITGVSSNDIDNASLSGAIFITNNSGTQSFTTTADLIAEGTETFTLTLGSPASGSINVSITDPVSGAKGSFLSFFDE